MAATTNRLETLCSRIMSHRVLSLRPEQPIAKAYAIMKENGFHHMAILGDDDHLKGVLSLGDILLVARKDGEELQFPDQPVATIMSVDPITCSREHTTAQVADLMIQHKIMCLPVVSSRDKLIGIITSTDLLELVRTELEPKPLPGELFQESA